MTDRPPTPLTTRRPPGFFETQWCRYVSSKIAYVPTSGNWHGNFNCGGTPCVCVSLVVYPHPKDNVNFAVKLSGDDDCSVEMEFSEFPLANGWYSYFAAGGTLPGPDDCVRLFGMLHG
jgi:hypothetical protein